MRHVLTTVAIAATLCAPGTTAAAQRGTAPPAPPQQLCFSDRIGGGPDCPLDRRLVFEVDAPGSDSADVWSAIAWGARHAGVTPLRLDRAATADSGLYAVVEVARTPSGGYEVAYRLAGSAAPPTVCTSVRAAIISQDRPLTFGVLLGQAIQRLTACAQQVRRMAR